MISKWKMEMLAFLTSLTLVSVGFSSWQITGPVIENTTGNIQSEPVIKTDKYVELTATAPEYNAGGFIVSDTTVDGGYIASDTGELKITFTLTKDCFAEDSPFIYINENGEYQYENLTIYCDITLRNKSTQEEKNSENDFFNIASITPSKDSANISAGVLISEDTIKTSRRLKITTDKLADIDSLDDKNAFDFDTEETFTFTITLAMTITNKSLIYNALDGNEFVFNTQVYGTK